MPLHKLKNAPLIEVIFEVFWEPELDANGTPFDPGFDRALGKFEAIVIEQFPLYKRTVPENSVVKVFPQPIHQYWKGELLWPVIQIGPGVLTVNDTDLNYSWKDNFQKNIYFALNALHKSYDKPFRFEKIKLTYIDAVAYHPEESTAHDFIARSMHVSVLNSFDTKGAPSGINLTQQFTIDENLLLAINIRNGNKPASNQSAIVWTTSVETLVGIELFQINEWLENAHSVASKTFVDMLKPELYASFD